MTTSSDETPDAANAASSGDQATLRTVFNGLSWNTLNQVIAVLINLALTPFLLHRLGLAAYGVFGLVSSFRGLLSNLDGGLGPCATRYFAVLAGSRDRDGASSLLVTMSLMTFLVVGGVATVAAVTAPGLTVVLHTTTDLRRQATTLIVAFMPLLVISSMRMLFDRLLTAEHRWAFVSTTETVALLAYAALCIVLLDRGMGLMALLWASVGREAVQLVASAFAARRYVRLRSMRLMPWSKVRELIRYSSRVQVAEVASSFNIEIDAIVVGLILPVRDVGLYTIGSNFSTELLNLPLNAMPPIAVTLSRAFGRHGLPQTIVEFTKLQRVWVRSVAAFALIGAASAIVAIPKWLGPRERAAGIVAAILLLGQSVKILSKVMDALGKSVNKPGLESRYLSAGMVVNMALTVPLALTVGMFGVPIGTAVGEAASVLYFLRIARREISSALRSFFAEVPRTAVMLSVMSTVILEIPAARLAPQGVLGLLTCAVPAAAGLALYAAFTLDIPALRDVLRRSALAERPGLSRLVKPAAPAPSQSGSEAEPKQ